MTDLLQEYCDSRGVSMRVDRQAGVIRGVKLLGLESRNGRDYLPEAVAEAARLYEDAKVNVNHPKGNPSGPRDYQDRIGAIRQVAFRPGEGLFGDFHFNPKHALAEQLVWDAEHAPENVGFSHNVEAKVARRGQRTMVEAITRVQSVDLVADPATTRGLFESAPESEQRTTEDVHRDNPEGSESLPVEPMAEIERLRREVERLTALESDHRRRATALRLLREFELPAPEATDARARTVVSGRFFESLLAAPDEAAMRALVEERARLVRALRSDAAARPESRDQHGVYAPMSAVSFVRAIT
ncbi:MAG: hypothetical protein ABFC77_03505 [Thermoguttaceae bacterium]